MEEGYQKKSKHHFPFRDRRLLEK